MMQLLVAIIAAGAMMGAQAKDDQLTEQQQRMKDCNAQANQKALRGDERQDYLSSCLRSHGDTRQLTAQQEKMRTCNRTAGERNLKGDERRGFMSQCLRAGGGDEGRERLTAQQERMV